MATSHSVVFAIVCNISLERNTMNKDQVEGRVKVAEGKIQQGVGKVTGSEKQQAKGLLKQAAGKTQKNFGDAKQAAKDAVNGN
jgi:uncharacterized protein YjbJ (UPF0337 family)